MAVPVAGQLVSHDHPLLPPSSPPEVEAEELSVPEFAGEGQLGLGQELPPAMVLKIYYQKMLKIFY